MTDQPSTQERCLTCGRLRDERYSRLHGGRCPNPWHGSQDVEEADPKSSVGKGLTDEDRPASTTQEAEKALEATHPAEGIAQANVRHVEALVAEVRSLRTQHTEDREEIERLQDGVEAATREIHKQGWQHTKDQERIEELEKAVREAERLLNEEANGSDVPPPVRAAWDDYYKARPGGPPSFVSAYDSEAYLAQERAWEILEQALHTPTHPKEGEE